ncbi:MAG: hypothetical protein ACXAC8_15075 [Candidatus Hodarchaeales archaeon]|jgi:hypothetical protein
MVLFAPIAPFIWLFNLIFFILGVPFVLWLNNKTRNDWICLGLGIFYMILYGLIAEPGWDEWLFFSFGLVVGYITDYWGVKSKKWKYHPWDPNFGHSYYVGFAWGMVTIFTYNISKSIPASVETIFLPGALFIIPMFFFEWRFGETRRDQYFLFARAIFTMLAFYNNLSLLFIAIFVGSYIEFAGVNWIKNWIYIDDMSYIFLSFGYSLMILTAKIIVDLITVNLIELAVLIFFVLASIFYFIDTFWAQKRVKIDNNKAEMAARRYHQK